MSEQNKAIVRRYFEEVWNQRNPDAIDEFWAADYVNHNAPPGMSDRRGQKQLIAMSQAAFHGQVTIEDQIAEGDRVVTRWSGQSTHRGEFMGIPPTGKTVTLTGISIDRVAGGQIVESWW
jgi:predicted ester cyclase